MFSGESGGRRLRRPEGHVVRSPLWLGPYGKRDRQVVKAAAAHLFGAPGGRVRGSEFFPPGPCRELRKRPTPRASPIRLVPRSRQRGRNVGRESRPYELIGEMSSNSNCLAQFSQYVKTSTPRSDSKLTATHPPPPSASALRPQSSHCIACPSKSSIASSHTERRTRPPFLAPWDRRMVSVS